jgi:hypothetical protein
MNPIVGRREMKNLFFLMMAIMLINVSYAGEMGENQKGDCVDSPQHSRTEEVAQVDVSQSKKPSSAEETATNK